ncbi:MAG: FG-GAP repeat protein [Alphaproteobacteria bacterium]|nr:FG-GAP repeat protein [Alphaproteobacteria bacterium]
MRASPPLWPSLLLLVAACDKGPQNTGQVTSNNPPSIASVVLEPDPAYAEDVISVVIDTVDLDGDELSVGVTWTVDGDEVASDVASIPALSAVRGQVVAVEVTVSDGFAFGEPVEASLTVLNTAPVTESVAIDPATPSLGDPLTCVVSDRDADGDPLNRSIRWNVDGAEHAVQGALLDEDLARNTPVFCTSWVDDGELESEHVSSDTVYIGNSPPGSPTIALVPDPPTDCSGGAVVITREAYDPDDDPVSYGYVWTDADGNEVCNADTCGGGVFTAQSSYTVTVTPYDGFLYGEPATLSFAAVAAAETFGNDFDDDCDGEVDEWITSAWQAQGLWWDDATGAEAGAALGVGDVDGDGWDDVLVGSNGSGDVQILLARDAQPEAPAWPEPGFVISGASQPGSVTGGDVDGDGLDDLLIGAVGDDGAASDAGAVMLVLGADLASAPLDDLTAWELRGDEAQERLGSTLDLGDLDGDGYADAVVGEPLADAPGRESGEVYLFTGLRSASGVVSGSDAQAVLQGGGRGGLFGASVAIISDLDGDGLSELAVGAPEIDDGGTDAGGVAIWYGGGISSGYRTEADLLILGDTNSGFLGREPVSAADVDGDGLADLVVGSEAWGSVSLPGTLHLLLGADLSGSSVSVSQAWARIEDSEANAALGLYGSGPALADADGDGRAELMAGAGGAGRVMLWSADTLAAGGDLSEADALILITAEDEGDRFGRSAIAADVDGDGDAELVTAASRSGVRADQGGGVYVFAPPYGVPAALWSPDCEEAGGRVFCRVPVSWDEARARCRDIGLDLARLESSATNSAASADAEALYPAATTRGRWWVGLSDVASEGSWVWLDDSSPTGFSAWASNAPSSSTDANCAAINSPTAGAWRDLDCEEPLFFICE